MCNISFLVWLSGEGVIAHNGKYKTLSMASILTFPALLKLLASKNSTPSATLSVEAINILFPESCIKI